MPVMLPHSAVIDTNPEIPSWTTFNDITPNGLFSSFSSKDMEPRYSQQPAETPILPAKKAMSWRKRKKHNLVKTRGIYLKPSDHQRRQLIKMTQHEGQSILSVSAKLNIKYTTARNIIQWWQ